MAEHIAKIFNCKIQQVKKQQESSEVLKNLDRKYIKKIELKTFAAINIFLINI